MMANPNTNPVDPPGGLCSDCPPGIARKQDAPRLFSWSEDRLILLALLLLAWGSRVGLAAWMGLGQIEKGTDARAYYSEAVALVEGKGLVGNLPNGSLQLTAFNMPLTPLLLACGMKVFGTTAIVAKMVAVSIGSLAAPLMYLIAGTIMPRRWALLAGLACAIHPSYFFHSIQTLTEPFYAPFLLLAVLLAVRAIRRPGFATAFADGIAWGLAALCRPHAVPALILAAFGMGLIHRSWRPVLGLVLGTALVLTPWWTRNFVVFGKPVLLSLEGGETFLGANNPYVFRDPELAGMWIAPMSIPEYRARMIRCETEIEVSDCQMEIGLNYLRDHPQVIPRLVFNKWIRWLTPVTKSGGLVRVMVLSTYGVLLALIVIGVVLRKVRYCPLLVPTLAITLADLAIVGAYWGNLSRGRIALELIWLPWGVQTFRLLAGAPIAGWYRRRMREGQEPPHSVTRKTECGQSFSVKS
jgi:hypothetical protein